MIGGKFGHLFDKPLEGIARRIPFHPNTITVTGFLMTLLASGVLLSNLALGGLLVLGAAFFDVLDGVVARINQKQSSFGAFFDSVLDRYCDAFIFLGIGFNMLAAGNRTAFILSLFGLVGGFLVSYTRARAEGLGYECRSGILERPERVVLIALGAISGLIMPALWLLAVLTQFTAIQRIYTVWKASRG